MVFLVMVMLHVHKRNGTWGFCFTGCSSHLWVRDTSLALQIRVDHLLEQSRTLQVVWSHHLRQHVQYLQIHVRSFVEVFLTLNSNERLLNFRGIIHRQFCSVDCLRLLFFMHLSLLHLALHFLPHPFYYPFKSLPSYLCYVVRVCLGRFTTHAPWPTVLQRSNYLFLFALNAASERYAYICIALKRTPCLPQLVCRSCSLEQFVSFLYDNRTHVALDRYTSLW